MFDYSEWIWCAGASEKNAYADFYSSAEADKDTEGILRISAQGDYRLEINGELISFGQYADFEEYKVYDEVTVSLRKGKNDIKITVNYPGTDFSAYRKAIPGVIFELTAGEKCLAFSSEKTLCGINRNYISDSGIITGQLGYSYIYDSTALQGKTVPASIVNGKNKILYPRPVRKLSVTPLDTVDYVSLGTFYTDEEKPLCNGMGAVVMNAAIIPDLYMVDISTIHRHFNGSAVVEFKTQKNCRGVYVTADLKRESTGVLRFDIEVEEVCDIIFAFGEHLQIGRINAGDGVNCNFCVGYRARKGHNEYTGTFRRLGCRYIEMYAFTKNVKVKYIGIDETMYPLNYTAYFNCGDSLHNKICEVGKRTLHLCMHEHYEDCPWREQSLYSMDTRNQMLCGYYAFGEYEFAAASIRLMALGIRDDDLLELCNPARVGITIPCFTAVYPLLVWEYMLYSGDTSIVKEVVPALKRIGNMFLNRIGDNGLVKTFNKAEHWNFYEWQQGLIGTIGARDEYSDLYACPLNAFVSVCFASLSKIFKALDDSDGDKYSAATDCLNDAMVNVFWDDEKCAFASYSDGTKRWEHFSQLVQALCVYCGCVETDKLDGLLDKIAYDEKLLPATPSHQIFVYDALMCKPDMYGRWVFGDIAGKWGNMLYSGASSFWETFKGADDFAGRASLCHGWSAIPVYMYYRYALGIKPEGLGFKFDTVNPADTGIPGCCGMINRPDGSVFEVKL